MFERIVESQVHERGAEPAVDMPGLSWSYAQLDADSTRCAHRLAELRLPPASRVCLAVNHLYLHWTLALGLERLGMVVVALPTSPDAQTSAWLGLRAVLSDAAPPPLTIPAVRIDDAWVEETGRRPTARIDPPRGPADPVRIMLSSGTTGRPKKLLLTRAELDLRIRNGVLSQSYLAGRARRAFSEVGAFAMPGLISAYAAWSVGGTLLGRGPGADWAGFLTGLKPSVLVVPPVVLQHLLKSLPEDFERPAELVVFPAGGSLTAHLVEETQRKLTREIVVSYGATESGGVAQTHVDALGQHPTAAGYLHPWTAAQVVDGEGRPLPPGEVGELRLASDEMSTGYLEDEELNQARFRDGWFYPGDLGVFTADGLLAVVGRTDDLMNLGGDKTLPFDIERPLMGMAGVEDLAAFSIPDDSGLERACVAVVPGEGFDREAAEAALRAGFRHPVALTLTNHLPRNAMGKIDRARLRAAVVENEAKGGPES